MGEVPENPTQTWKKNYKPDQNRIQKIAIKMVGRVNFWEKSDDKKPWTRHSYPNPKKYFKTQPETQKYFKTRTQPHPNPTFVNWTHHYTILGTKNVNLLLRIPISK